MLENLLKDNPQEQWNRVKENLKINSNITSVAYNVWIEPLELYSVKGNTITLLVTNSNKRFIVDYIQSHYLKAFQVEIEALFHENAEIVIILPNELSEQDFESNKDRLSEENKNLAVASHDANLNSKYTFDTFIVGPNNRFAQAAAFAVAETPAPINAETRYNPLFIYGGVGLGKTHLMQSIAHYILEKYPNLRVLYVTSEKFTSELIEAIRSKNNIDFKDKYRNIDVFLIDDIQFIIGKDATQEEFFHTFNYLYESNKQIVISSDKPPKEFTTLEDRLRTRFAAGLPVDIGAPDYETRMAVLRKKLEMDHYTVDETILRYIATNITSNIRELEGALTKVSAYAKLSNTQLTIEMAEDALKDMIQGQQKTITTQYIIEEVAQHFGFTVDDLISHKRNKGIAYPRQITMYLCRELTNASLQQIGNDMGNRDHTTIRHGIEKIASELKTDVGLRDNISALTKKIKPVG